MKFRACLIMLAVIALNLPNFYGKYISAQEQKPSLAVTVEWLKENSEYVSGISSDVPRQTYKYAEYMGNSDVWELASYNSCSLVWKGKKKIAYYNDRYSEIEMTVTVSLADFNPDRIKMDDGGILQRLAHSQIFQSIKLFTTDRKKLVKWQFFIKETISDNNSLKAKITGNPSKKTKESIESFDANTLEIRVTPEKGQSFLNAIKNGISRCGGKVDKKEPF